MGTKSKGKKTPWYECTAWCDRLSSHMYQYQDKYVHTRELPSRVLLYY